MAEGTQVTITIKSIEKDGKDGKHYYDSEMGGKKFYRWKVVTEEGDTIYVRKTEENGPQPYEVGAKLRGVLTEKEKDGRKRKILTKIDQVDESGKVVSTATKSTFNDPAVTVPKMRAESLGAAIRVVLKLLEWEEKTGLDFNTKLIQAPHLYSMQSVFFTYITDDMKDINRDSMDLRLKCLHLAISCMELPAFVHLKGNDEGGTDSATGRPIIKKKLSVKLVEQADVYFTHARAT